MIKIKYINPKKIVVRNAILKSMIIIPKIIVKEIIEFVIAWSRQVKALTELSV